MKPIATPLLGLYPYSFSSPPIRPVVSDMV
jgi:hypothetical protein